MHFAATRALRRLKGSDTVSQQDRNGNLATKFLRIFAAQTEALQRYRGKGQQKVTIEHVHVHTGGQAIVGSVSQSGGGGIMTKTADKPMRLKTREPSRLRQACHAARTRRGRPCQSPAVAGKARCRMHGGAAGSGAPKGKRNGKYRHRLHYRCDR